MFRDVQPAPHPDHDYALFPLPLEEQLEAARQEIALLTQENNSLKTSRFGSFQNDLKLLTIYTGFQITSNTEECSKPLEGSLIRTLTGLTKREVTVPSLFASCIASVNAGTIETDEAEPTAELLESAFERAGTGLGVSEPASAMDICSGGAARVIAGEHDYATPPPAGFLDAAFGRMKELETGVQRLLRSLLTVHRFCATDEDFRFYTRFPSEQVFRVFWESVAPSATRLVYWAEAQRIGKAVDPTTPRPQKQLTLIDEFFVYCLRVASGLQEKIVADIFDISPSAVSRATITWANYLYLVLGSVPIWISREQAAASVPAKLKKSCPDLRVILGRVEIECESPSSSALHSETFSFHKHAAAFKGLVGVAPGGTVTFVSRLHAGSVSDATLARLSGVLGLLEPGDQVAADEGFAIDDALADVGARLVTPPLKQPLQFAEEVRRVIGRVKEYHIWDSAVPLGLAGCVNQIWTNCCLMVKYQGPVCLKDQSAA